MSVSLEKWVEAAVTVADAENMKGEEVIPTWPDFCVKRFPDLYPQLTVGALREWWAGPWDKASLINALANIRDTGASAKTLREIAGRALSAVELEGAFECREFAKLYRFAGLGQVLVVLDTSGCEKADALITFQFWPGVEGVGVCSTYLGFLDGESGPAAEKAEKFFSELTAEAAERIAGESAQEIREGWNRTEEMSDE